MEIKLSERTEQARQRLKATLDADPALKKTFKETRKHFEKPGVIRGMANTIGKMKDAFESGKVKEAAEKFKEKHGLSGDTKLTDDMRRKLAEELVDGILGKK